MFACVSNANIIPFHWKWRWLVCLIGPLVSEKMFKEDELTTKPFPYIKAKGSKFDFSIKGSKVNLWVPVEPNWYNSNTQCYISTFVLINLSILKEKDFWKHFMLTILVMWSRPFEQTNVRSPIPWRHNMKLVCDRLRRCNEKIFVDCVRCLPKLTYDDKGSGKLRKNRKHLMVKWLGEKNDVCIRKSELSWFFVECVKLF